MDIGVGVSLPFVEAFGILSARLSLLMVRKRFLEELLLSLDL